MVKLFCAIVGVAGSVFPVDIDAAQSVGDLKKVIAEDQKYDFAASKLQLFLAKKDGEWIKDDDTLDTMLSDGADTSTYMMMRASWKLNKQILFAPEVSLGEDVIHVLVVVPEQRTSAPIVSQDGVFDHCSNPFFSQLPTVDEVDGWLVFTKVLPLTERQRLFVRFSYKSIASQALSKEDPNRRKYAVITGTPGIGKSVFIYYVMWRLIKDHKRVLLFDSEGTFYFDGTRMLACKALPDKSNRQFWSPDLWCLVDSVDPTSIAALPYRGCSILLASTPRRDCISEFKKLAPTPDVLYMPLWTKEELATVAPMYPNAADTWEYRFHCLGGVPRLVLEDITTDPQALLISACSSCSFDDCIMLVSIYSESNAKTKIAQTLIHIRSQEPYKEYEVVYASELAMQVIARTKWRSDRAKMQSLLGSCDGNPLAQSLCGYIFEPHSIRLLEEGGSFVYRKLLSGAEMRKMKRKRRCVVDDDKYIDIPRLS